MKKKNNFGAIDIGSYNCRLLIAEESHKGLKTLCSSSFPTNLIKNLSFNNEFNEENISKTLSCLKIFSDKLSKFNVVDYRCVATEACRTVINPDFFTKHVKLNTGIDVEIISSEEEARLSLKSCEIYLKKIEDYGFIFDIGGGSTELTLFDLLKSKYQSKSISYGVINLSEKKEIYDNHYVDNQLRRHFNHFKKLTKDLNRDFITIGSCSTVTTICSVFQNLKYYDPRKIEGFEMSLDNLNYTINYLTKASISKLKKHPCIGHRYKLLKNGLIILSIILESISVKKMIVTQKSLRQAIINELKHEYEKKNKL